MTVRSKKAEKLKPVYLITGSDGPKVEKAIRRLRERVASDSGTDLNIDVFDASASPALEVLQAAGTPPFGDGVRLVLVKNSGFFSKPDKDAICTYLSDPPAHAVLALTGGGIRKNEALYKAVQAAGQVLSFESPSPANMPRWAQEQAAGLNLKLGSREARRLVFLTGADQRAIIAELEKLSAYLGGGAAVGMEEIDDLCWVSSEVRIWDLTDALGAKNRAAVFRHLEAMLAIQTAPATAFFSIARHLRLLAEVVAARDRGEDAAGAARALGLKPYPARKLAEQSKGFATAQLRQAVRIIAELDADIKGRVDIPPDLALEMALSRVLDAVS